MPRVFNKHHGNASKDAVYIGRGSKWGNPYLISKNVTREQAIEKYKLYLITSGLINSIKQLEGKDLVCYCSPKPCHGDILIELANDGKDIWKYYFK